MFFAAAADALVILPVPSALLALLSILDCPKAFVDCTQDGRKGRRVRLAKVLDQGGQEVKR